MQLNSEAETIIPRAGLLKGCSWFWYVLLETPTLDSQLCFMFPCHGFAGMVSQKVDYSFLRAGIDSILCFLYVACLLDKQFKKKKKASTEVGMNPSVCMSVHSFIHY